MYVEARKKIVVLVVVGERERVARSAVPSITLILQPIALMRHVALGYRLVVDLPEAARLINRFVFLLVRVVYFEPVPRIEAIDKAVKGVVGDQDVAPVSQCCVFLVIFPGHI